MAYQTAAPVDDKRMAVLADLDLRDHVPDQLEVYLGDGDAALSAVTLCHGEVGLAFLVELDGAKVNPFRHRFDECRVVRAVGPAANDIWGNPRHAQLLAALAVNLGQLCDGRNNAQQADIVEVPLFVGQFCPLSLGHPPELRFDLTHAGFDPLGGCLRLLALHFYRSAPVVLVNEIKVERGVKHQDHHDQAHEGDEVFEEEAALHLSAFILSPVSAYL